MSGGCFFLFEKDLNLKKAQRGQAKVPVAPLPRCGAQTGTERRSLWVGKHERCAAALSCHSDQKNSFRMSGGCFFLFEKDLNLKKAQRGQAKVPVAPLPRCGAQTGTERRSLWVVKHERCAAALSCHSDQKSKVHKGVPCFFHLDKRT